MLSPVSPVSLGTPGSSVVCTKANAGPASRIEGSSPNSSSRLTGTGPSFGGVAKAILFGLGLNAASVAASDEPVLCSAIPAECGSPGDSVVSLAWEQCRNIAAIFGADVLSTCVDDPTTPTTASTTTSTTFSQPQLRGLGTSSSVNVTAAASDEPVLCSAIPAECGNPGDSVISLTWEQCRNIAAIFGADVLSTCVDDPTTPTTTSTTRSTTISTTFSQPQLRGLGTSSSVNVTAAASDEPVLCSAIPAECGSPGDSVVSLTWEQCRNIAAIFGADVLSTCVDDPTTPTTTSTTFSQPQLRGLGTSSSVNVTAAATWFCDRLPDGCMVDTFSDVNETLASNEQSVFCLSSLGGDAIQDISSCIKPATTQGEGSSASESVALPFTTTTAAQDTTTTTRGNATGAGATTLATSAAFAAVAAWSVFG